MKDNLQNIADLIGALAEDIEEIKKKLVAKDSGFFTDLQSRSREKIVWFPKIYYQMDNGLLHILCEITMGKYQEQLLSLEDKLEAGLYCELTDKTLHDGYIEYTLLYDMIANRISIDEVVAENGGLRLMKNLVWEHNFGGGKAKCLVFRKIKAKV